MTIRYYRSGTPSFGLWIDDDGVARSWQSSGAAIGRFARELYAAERAAIERALADAAASSPTTVPDDGPVPPGGTSTETVLTESLEINVSAGDDPPDSVAGLVEALRTLIDNLLESPVAAIVLEIADPSGDGRLRHAGSEPIRVRLQGLTMTTTVYAADYTVADSIKKSVDAEHDGPVEAGWELALPDTDAGAPDGGFVSITVGPAEVDVEGNGVLRRTEFGWVSE